MAYCAGLENRILRKRDGGSNPSLSDFPGTNKQRGLREFPGTGLGPRREYFVPGRKTGHYYRLNICIALRYGIYNISYVFLPYVLTRIWPWDYLL